MHRIERSSENDVVTWWPDLSKRTCDMEMMDALDSDAVQLANTLKQFRSINRWLTPCHRLIHHHFLSVMKADPNRGWTLLDLGAGGGDLPIWLVGRCNALGIRIEVTCLDHDPRVVDFLQHRCRPFRNISIVQADAIELASVDQRWDFVFANHFLHHLSDEDLITILKTVDQIATTKYLLSDLVRSRLSYVAYTAMLPLRMANNFAWHDGRVSIRKAFTIADGNEFITAAGLEGKATVKRFFPGHMAIMSESSAERR